MCMSFRYYQQTSFVHSRPYFASFFICMPIYLLNLHYFLNEKHAKIHLQDGPLTAPNSSIYILLTSPLAEWPNSSLMSNNSGVLVSIVMPSSQSQSLNEPRTQVFGTNHNLSHFFRFVISFTLIKIYEAISSFFFRQVSYKTICNLYWGACQTFVSLFIEIESWTNNITIHWSKMEKKLMQKQHEMKMKWRDVHWNGSRTASKNEKKKKKYGMNETNHKRSWKQNHLQ